ncbi:hypothetical protein RJ640_016731 [Escallonia rubra]|uniref:Ty3 transposon capsid-like protein domain-containing protein n=1 Tax=Escallonia rubra TaxID=112253 RepID=A0AA88RF45_9ASTE|nr:hypothetical protein RJ640_016731 [Escallonia rubra]
MPRSSKTSYIETDSIGPMDGLERKLETYDLRFGSLDATLGDLQKNYSEMKFEMMSTVTQINARLKALMKNKQQVEAGTSKGNSTPPPVGNFSSVIPVSSLPRIENSVPKPCKLSFPRFNGDNPRGWVRKCEQYFEFCPLHEDFKVAYASVHFEDQVEYWYATYIKPLGKVNWDRFVKDLCARFLDVSRDSVIGEFNQLKQVATVGEYYNYFEELRAQVVEEFGIMDESYFVKSFIEGLKPEIISRIEQFEVATLTRAIHIARKEEIAISNLFKQTKPTSAANQHPFQTSSRPNITFNPRSPTVPSAPSQIAPNLPTVPSSKGILPTPNLPQTRPTLPVKRMSHKEHQLKREQGLCFWCDSKFTPGHQKVCPKRSIAMLIAGHIPDQYAYCMFVFGVGDMELR